MVNNLLQSQRVVNTHVQSDMMLKHGAGEWATMVKSGMAPYIHLVLCQKSLNTQTTNLQLVSLGYSHTCAIVENGDVYCWGRNHIGQLGVGNTTDQYLPTKVLLPSGRTATAIEAGAYHTCAILDDNSIKCWGQNTNGQIGDGTTDYRDSPASVILAGLSNPIQISAGTSSTCALFDNGRIKCWGSNSNRIRYWK